MSYTFTPYFLYNRYEITEEMYFRCGNTHKIVVCHLCRWQLPSSFALVLWYVSIPRKSWWTSSDIYWLWTILRTQKSELTCPGTWQQYWIFQTTCTSYCIILIGDTKHAIKLTLNLYTFPQFYIKRTQLHVKHINMLPLWENTDVLNSYQCNDQWNNRNTIIFLYNKSENVVY